MPTERNPGAPTITISVTEDDPAVLDALYLILDRAGYLTSLHADARETMAEGNAVPDLFIIDRQLSGIDGLELCGHLRAGAATAGVPVMIMSATPHVARLAAEAGATAFLEKPFRRTELLAMVLNCLSEAGKK